jgi:hypothetical protein
MTEILHGDTDDRLSVTEYAIAKGVSTRSVKRWLADEQLPGAEKDPFSGEWRIPATAVRQQNAVSADVAKPVNHSELLGQLGIGTPAGAEVVSWQQMPEPAPPTMRERLDDETGYLKIADAAAYLGIPQAQILAHPEKFGVEEVGDRGSARVPQRIIRRIMGV